MIHDDDVGVVEDDGLLLVAGFPNATNIFRKSDVVGFESLVDVLDFFFESARCVGE